MNVINDIKYLDDFFSVAKEHLKKSLFSYKNEQDNPVVFGSLNFLSDAKGINAVAKTFLCMIFEMKKYLGIVTTPVSIIPVKSTLDIVVSSILSLAPEYFMLLTKGGGLCADKGGNDVVDAFLIDNYFDDEYLESAWRESVTYGFNVKGVIIIMDTKNGEGPKDYYGVPIKYIFNKNDFSD